MACMGVRFLGSEPVGHRGMSRLWRASVSSGSFETCTSTLRDFMKVERLIAVCVVSESSSICEDNVSMTYSPLCHTLAISEVVHWLF